MSLFPELLLHTFVSLIPPRHPPVPLQAEELEPKSEHLSTPRQPEIIDRELDINTREILVDMMEQVISPDKRGKAARRRSHDKAGKHKLVTPAAISDPLMTGKMNVTEQSDVELSINKRLEMSLPSQPSSFRCDLRVCSIVDGFQGGCAPQINSRRWH